MPDCHKAPSAKRCIKTINENEPIKASNIVIKHRAPNGALRQAAGPVVGAVSGVIKHRAPNGALRLVLVLAISTLNLSHKAPSAKRCIKTPQHDPWGEPGGSVIKHRAPNGALRQIGSPSALVAEGMS